MKWRLQFIFYVDKCVAHFPSMVSECKKHEFVVNKKPTADQYQGGTQPTSPQNGWTEKRNQKFITEKINIC